MTEHKIDATNQSFGRMASQVAKILTGKTNPNYQPHVMPEEKVLVENVTKIKFTGKKFQNKIYYRYSGYPGGISSRTLEERWNKSPSDVLRKSVLHMLPKNKLRKKIIKNLIIK